MGFKFKRVDLVAGSEEWPTGNDDSTREVRGKLVTKKVSEAIINCNCGWALDTSKNPTIDDLVFIPGRESPYGFWGLFFTNSISGCKLFVSYFGESPRYGINDFSGNGDTFRVATNNSTCCGLCMSMIPAGSTSIFGDPTTSSFLPADATRIIGTVNRESIGTDKIPFGGDPTSGNIYSWGVFVTSYCIAISCCNSSANPGNIYIPVCAIGRLFGSLNHSSDMSVNSKYGCITFRSSYGSSANSEGTTNTITFYTANYSTSSNNIFVGINPYYAMGFSSYIGQRNVFGSIAKANGTWINGTDGESYGVTLYPADVSQLSGYVYNSTNSGKSRWCPFYVRVLSSDLDTYGVVPGDGMKGYLDTDLFRCAIGTYGQQFDNGNFICIDGDYNFLIGWDPNNDPLVGE